MRLRPEVTACAAVLALSQLAWADPETVVDRSPQTWRFLNRGPAQKPVVTIVGVTDPSTGAVTHGPTLNGVRLAERLWTGARLELRFDAGEAVLTYNPGYEHYADKADLERAMLYRKFQFDATGDRPMEARHYFLDAASRRHLRLGWPRRDFRITYKLHLPAGAAWRRVWATGEIVNWTPGAQARGWLSADPEGKQVISQQLVDQAQARQSPSLFDLDAQGRNPVYLNLGSAGAQELAMGSAKFYATADIGAMPALELPAGEQTLRYTDEPSSSHRCRITVRTADGPVIEDFEAETPAWSRHPAVQVQRVDKQAVPPYGGGHCGRFTITYPDPGAAVHLVRPCPVTDWRLYKSLHVALWVPERPPGQTLLGCTIQEGERRRWLMLYHLRPTPGWQHIAIDLTGKPVSHVHSIDLLTGILWRPGQKVTFYLDDIRLSAEPAATGRPRRPPEVLAAIRRHLLDQRVPEDRLRPVAPGPLVPAEAFFPIGPTVGGDFRALAEELGVDRWDVMTAVLDDLARHHQNAAFWNNFTADPDDWERLFRLAERRGLRLWFQGPIFYTMVADRPARLREWERVKREVEARGARFAADRALLAWSPAEEFPPECVPDFEPYQSLMARLDPAHPCVVIYNDVRSAQKAAELLKPRILSYDCYPILSDRPVEWIRAYYYDKVDKTYEAGRPYGARVWMVAQAYAEGLVNDRTLGLRRRHPTPAQMRWQAWGAVAHGATGLFLYYYQIESFPYPEDPTDVDLPVPEGDLFGYTSLKTHRAEDTEAWNAWAQTSRVLQQLAPLLLSVRRTAEAPAVTKNPHVELAGFMDPETAGRYVIAVNTRWDRTETFDLRPTSPGAAVFDVLAGRRLAEADLNQQTLPAGDGRLYLVGTDEAFARARRCLGR